MRKGIDGAREHCEAGPHIGAMHTLAPEDHEQEMVYSKLWYWILNHGPGYR